LSAVNLPFRIITQVLHFDTHVPSTAVLALANCANYAATSVFSKNSLCCCCCKPIACCNKSHDPVDRLEKLCFCSKLHPVLQNLTKNYSIDFQCTNSIIIEQKNPHDS